MRNTCDPTYASGQQNSGNSSKFILTVGLRVSSLFFRDEVSMSKALWLLLFGTITLVSCFQEDRDFASSVSGIVTDSISGLPIESALVFWDDTLGDEGVGTDSLGYYLMVKWGNGPTSIYVRKTGYRIGLQTFREWRGERKNVDFKLIPQ